MNSALPSRDVQLFVVHVWRQRTRFRASVRRVDREETQLFTTPTQLARYLATACGEPAPGTPATPPTDAAPARSEGGDTP